MNKSISQILENFHADILPPHGHEHFSKLRKLHADILSPHGQEHFFKLRKLRMDILPPHGQEGYQLWETCYNIGVWLSSYSILSRWIFSIYSGVHTCTCHQIKHVPFIMHATMSLSKIFMFHHQTRQYKHITQCSAPHVVT